MMMTKIISQDNARVLKWLSEHELRKKGSDKEGGKGKEEAEEKRREKKRRKKKN